MTLRSKFFFDGHARLAYGWSNPNDAAAVLVCLLPLLWIAYSQRPKEGNFVALLMLLTTESVVTLMLVLTYSRGAVIAWFGAVFFFHFGSGAFRAELRLQRTRIAALAWRTGLFAALLVVTGVSKRMATIAEGDGSAINRLELWNGGLRLIEMSPWRGWGAGNSGVAFIQWLQDPMATARYVGMVNSYIHLGVEFGLAGIAGLCFFILLPVIVYIRRSRDKRDIYSRILLGCSSGMVAFGVANIFTSLWMIPSVIWAPVALFVMFALIVPKVPKTWAIDALIAGGVSVVVAGIIYGAALFATRGDPWKLTRLAEGGVLFTGKDWERSNPTLYFLVDGRTLGANYGKEIRAAVAENPGLRRFGVFPPGALPGQLDGITCIIFGSRVRNAEKQILKNAIIVLPSAAPPAVDGAGPAKVLLPEFDQIGYAQQWRDWCGRTGCSVVTAKSTGQSLRGQLSGYLAPMLNELTTPKP